MLRNWIRPNEPEKPKELLEKEQATQYAKTLETIGRLQMLFVQRFRDAQACGRTTRDMADVERALAALLVGFE